MTNDERKRQRELFEAWAARAMFDSPLLNPLATNTSGDCYLWPVAQNKWNAWQACCEANGVGEPSEWIRDVLKWGANLKPDIELAQLANDGAEFREDFCTCDPPVGMSPCQYCAIHDVLRRTLELSHHCAAVLDAIEGRCGTIDEILAALAKREERG